MPEKDILKTEAIKSFTPYDFKQIQTCVIVSLTHFWAVGETEMPDLIQKRLLPKLKKMVDETEYYDSDYDDDGNYIGDEE